MGVMIRVWSLRPRSLCAGFWAGERVNVSANQRQSISAAPSTNKNPTLASCRVFYIPYATLVWTVEKAKMKMFSSPFDPNLLHERKCLFGQTR
ncbi:hypothetical protein FU656_04105 [Lacticaseibacillus rhamnosus]|uniref:Uncharacterized protein n=1 Tax=Lacticaseibacillus rhamnosus TaxID=47715 RepID=A0AAP8J283_LACRH|nr:hypothetical protein CYJ91_00870 [Lacticaseibacillus rhamnosus]TXK07230.1 hypothetical protein FU656_04105 [Lacticaseibacillus rhamnosus]